MKLHISVAQFERGFTMIELVVVIILLGTLAGVLAPIVLQSKKEAQAAKILATVDAITKACERFYLDNGRFPEDSTSAGASAKHELSVGGASLPQWKGPYIVTPMTLADSPEGMAITLLNSLDAAALSPKFPGMTGDGAALVYTGIDDEVALMVNNAIDGPEAHWMVEGKATFADASQTSPIVVGVQAGGTSISSSGVAGDNGSGSNGGNGTGGGGGGGSGSGGSSGLHATGIQGSSMTAVSKYMLKANAKLNICVGRHN